MALAIQPQWDIGSSIFSGGTQVIKLIAAATQDDVQVATVMAAEAIGSLMIVDTALIGQAVDALNQDKCHRIERIKLQMGLSKGGVSGQLQQSSAAIRAFLLISVLRLGLNAQEIGDILYEMLAEIQGVDMLPVSASQLSSFVAAVEGYALKMQGKGSDPLKFVSLMMDNAVEQASSKSEEIFCPLTPDTTAKVLLAAFDAIRNEDVHQLEMSGSESAVWLVTILCWLFPQAVRVVDWAGKELVSSVTQPAKVSLRLVEGGFLGWRLEYWYKTRGLSSLIDVPRSETYSFKIMPDYVTKDMVYVLHQRCRVSPPYDPSELGFVGTWACGLMLAAQKHGFLFRHKNEDLDTSKLDLPSISLGSVCSSSFNHDLDTGLIPLGWPEGSVNLQLAHQVAKFVIERASELILAEQWHALVETFDKEAEVDVFKSKSRSRDSNRGMMRHAMSLAETLLLHAIQEDFVEVKVGEILDSKHFPLISALVASSERRYEAGLYLAKSFSTVVTFNDIVSNSPQSNQASVLAASSRGQVLFLRGLLWDSVEAPTTAREAFQLIREPGQLKWRGTRQKLLFESQEQLGFWQNSQMGSYRLDERNKVGLPLLKPLRSLQRSQFQPAIKQANELKCIYLRCSKPSTGDEVTQLGPSLINFALATRVEPSDLPIMEQQQRCLDNGLSQLLFKNSNFPPIHHDPSWPNECTAVASYNGDDWGDLLRFGTYDARHMDCIVQGRASLLDCAYAAFKQYGSGWIIMAND